MILEFIFSFILSIISKVKYWGIFLFMALDSANIPIPSEITMPFSGFLSGKGIFNFWLVVLAGTIGSLFGSLISYIFAFKLKNILEKFLNKFSFCKEEYKKAELFFKKYGQMSVFWGRLIPVIRTFISFPAGIFKLKFLKFTFLTLIGSFIWSFLLTYLGFLLGENWGILEKYFSKFSYFILFILIVLIVIYIFRRFRLKRK
jgi:membrane protein DedA with SNARE-associated domain